MTNLKEMSHLVDIMSLLKFPCSFFFSSVKKWVPAVKEQWVTLITYVGPHVQMVSANAMEAYRVCINTVTLHVVNVKELANPYFQVSFMMTE